MSTKKKLASLTLQKNESTNTKQCRLRFSMCDSKHPMWDLDSEEIKEFIKFAKKYNTTWQAIYEKNKSVIGSDPNIIHAGQRLEI